jgi:hypothetical protein
MRARRKLFGEYAFLGSYHKHPDSNQERLFFGLLGECMELGLVTEEMLRKEIELRHVREDAMQVIRSTAPLAPPPGPPIALPA